MVCQICRQVVLVRKIMSVRQCMYLFQATRDSTLVLIMTACHKVF